MQPHKQWLEVYEKMQDQLSCTVNLNAYFSAEEIAEKKLDRLSLGMVSLPSGQVLVRDPLEYLRRHSKPYFQSVPSGEYEVTLVVIKPDNGDCARYAAALVNFSETQTVRYTQALSGNENLLNMRSGEYFGFPVDAGLACICDVQTRDAFIAFEKSWREECKDHDNLYDDYFAALFSESYRTRPLYQRQCGDWINWQIPGTAYHMPIFASGFGDGYYPVYFGYDTNGDISSLVVHLIDVEQTYSK